MSLEERIVDIAKKEVGNKEEGGNNIGEHIVKYQLATWLNPDPWPWCAAFTCWVLKKAVKDSDADIDLCRDASVRGWENWARKKGHQVLDEDDKCLPGDFVTFDFSHIGIVIEDNGKYIKTIEGNTNNKGQRDSETGDGVWIKVRRRELVKHFIRIQY
jgi:cell wall-associated NlpC family hydrolase